MKRTFVFISILSLFTTATTACKPQASQPAASEKRTIQMPADVHKTMPGGPEQMRSTQQIHGTVLEALDASRYTYIHVDTGAEKVWAAAPQFQVNVGDHVTFPQGMAMANFHSESLNRDFGQVYFVSAVRVEVAGHGKAHGPGPEEAPAGEASPSQADTGAVKKPVKAPVDLSGIIKADGGVTIAEIYADSTTLAGKEVVLRGKVVKFSPQILGTNWIHIQDGTGEAGKNDLTVTTSDSAKMGDTVLVKGVLATGKDFGGGYRYEVIVENAAVTVE